MRSFYLVWVIIVAVHFPIDSLCAEESHRPIFGIAFGEGAAVKGKLDSLNAGVSTAKEFPSMLGIINSEGVRIGDGLIELEGCYYDAETKALFSVSSTFSITGNEFRIEGIPVGRYSMKLSSSGSGKSLWSKEIEHNDDAKAIAIKIPKAVKVAGSVKGIPILASQLTMLMYGSTNGMIDINGRFSFETYANDTDEPYVIAYVPNPFPQVWNKPRIRYELFISSGSINHALADLTVPILSSQLNFEGLLSFDPHLLKNNYDKMVNHVILVIASSDGKVAQLCSPDESGRFFGIGLPKGDYTIGVSEKAGNPPFIADVINITLGEDKKDGIVNITIRPPN